MPTDKRLLVRFASLSQGRGNVGEPHLQSATPQEHLFGRDEHDGLRCTLHRYKFLKPSKCFIEIRIIWHGSRSGSGAQDHSCSFVLINGLALHRDLFDLSHFAKANAYDILCNALRKGEIKSVNAIIFFVAPV